MANDIFKNIWPEWEVADKPLGRGSYGVVYKAVRRDHGVESFAAIKVISIPQSESEVDSIRSEGLSLRDTKTYLEGVVTDFVSEIRLMESFKGVQNIVSVEDYKVVEKEDGIGWDIYIRMELLTPFNKYSADRTLSEQEVIKLGVDICTALELCAKRNVIHRDIKPENIFINEFGDFKLGDFGIARKLENATSGMSQKGTYNYMAPEVEKSSNYDATVDIYSLGIVLYRLMNKNRLPFCDLDKQILSPVEREVANRRRLDGEPLPAPCNASEGLAEVILCACEHDPENRFSTATAMKNALLSVASGSYQPSLNPGDKTVSVRHAEKADDPDKTVPARRSPGYNEPKKQEKQPIAVFGQKKDKSVKQHKEKAKLSKGKKAGIITAAILAVVLALGITGVVTYFGGAGYKAVKEMSRGNYSEAIELYRTDIKDNGLQSMIFDALLEKQYNEKLDDYAAGKIDYNETLDYVDAVISIGTVKDADKKLSEIITARSDAIIEEYKTGSLDYTKAKQELETLANKEKSILNTTYASEQLTLLSSLFSAASAYETAEQKMNSGNYIEAIAQLDQIPEYSELYADAQQKLAEATNAYKASVLEQAENYVQAENFPGAISVIEYALTIIPDDLELQNKLNEYQTAYHASVVSTALSESTALQSQGDYQAAMQVLTNAMNIVGEDAQLQTAYNTCERLYVEYIRTQVEEKLENNKWDEAKRIVDSAINNLPNNNELREILQYVLDAKPVRFYELTYVDYSNATWPEDASDSYGNNYYKPVVISCDRTDTGYIIVNLGGNFTEFNCTIAPLAGFDGRLDGRVKIYTDDVVVFDSKIDVTTAPIHVSIDVSDVTLLKIQFSAEESLYARHIIVADESLYK